MKNIFILLFTLLLLGSSESSFAQSYKISAFNNQTVTTCTGTFYDSGGATGNYSNGENYTITFCPNSGSSAIQINFGAFSLGNGDQLCVFDGVNTAAAAFGCFTNTTPVSIVKATSANSTGCLTLQFTSNNTAISTGWIGTISCSTPCQTVISQLGNSIPVSVPSVDGYIDICPGDAVTFYGQGFYPQNDTFYHQSDATSTFEWIIEGQSVPAKNAYHVFTNPGGYKVQLNITDSLGCKNINLLSQRVRVAPDPYFSGTNTSVSTLCIGDTAILSGIVHERWETFGTPISRGDSIFLPDGAGACYQTTLEVNDFNPGQTLTNINDLISICVNMEHSYMGDLGIQVTCPNGNTVTLHQYPGGGGTYLGIPIDVDADLSPGQGFDYCWAPFAPNGTWASVAAGVSTLPAGTYTSAQPLTGLLGCPLNGLWEIEICDNLAIDNGYIFNWGISFAPSVYPSLDSFSTSIITKQWTSDPTIVQVLGDSIIVAPTNAGTASYNFVVTNSHGCTYDTTINITVLPFTNPACFDCDTLQLPVLADTTVCIGESVPLDAKTTTTAFDDVTFSFSGTTPIPTGTFLNLPIPVSNITSPYVTATNLVSVCVDIDHIFLEDVDMYLIAPSGQIFELSTDNGGGGVGFSFTGTCFTPSATTSITAGASPFTGNYQPEGNWSSLIGEVVNSTWYIRIMDDSPGFDGTISYAGITFASPYIVNYAWSPTTDLSCSNCPNPTATPTANRTYVVTATDGFGCVKTDTVNINVELPPAAPALTCGTATGSAVTVNWNNVANAIGYEVKINNGNWVAANGVLSHTFNGLSHSTNYNISVRTITANGCASSNSTITCGTLFCDLSIILNNTTNVSCFGANDGTALATATTTNSPFSYSSNGTTNTTGAFSGYSGGSFNLIASDALGCLDTVVAIITEPDTISLAFTTIAVSCTNGNNGSATVTPTGGTAPYTFLWNTTPAQSTAVATGLTAGNYSVTVTDANNCTKTRQVTVAEPLPLFLTLGKTDVNCYQGNDGRAFIDSVSGGTGAYLYQWNTTPTQATDTINALTAGVYTLTVTDANNCTISQSITLNQGSELFLTLSPTNVSCFGAGNGQITTNVTGGVSGYTYLWNNAAVTTGLSNLTPNTYTVTVTDANACTKTDSATITQPSELLVTFSTNQVSCFGLSDGSATALPTGGTGGHTYQWNTNPIQTTPTINNLAVGNYTVTVTDATGCPKTATVNITTPVSITSSVTGVDVSCFGGNNGTATATASGGGGIYTYQWSNNNTGNQATGLTTGWHYVTIIDPNNCSAQDSVFIGTPTLIDLSLSSVSVDCYGNASGEATVQATGGTGTYSYNWNTAPPQTTATATNLAPATYTVSVTDVNNCTVSDTVSVFAPGEPIEIDFTTIPTNCNGSADGSASAIVVGGTPSISGYSYAWNNNGTSPILSNVAAGTYTLTVTDFRGCTKIDSVMVGEPAPITSITSSIASSCYQGSDGQAFIAASGGTPNAQGSYQFIWSNPTNTTGNTANNLNGGQTYTITITDTHNCTATNSVTIAQPTPIQSAVTTQNISCNGLTDGTATLLASGGTPPFLYQWDANANNQTTSQATNLGMGNYKVTITDVKGCTQVTMANITEPSPLAVTYFTEDVICKGESTGTITALVAGGTPWYSFAWDSTIAASDTSRVANIAAGTYTLTVTDGNGCENINSITITEPVEAISASYNITNVSCFGKRDGRLLIMAQGGNAPYAYSLNGSSYNSSPIKVGLKAGVYIIDIKDNVGCVFQDTVTLTQPDLIVLDLGADLILQTGQTVAIVPNIAFAVPPYTYLWSPNDSTISCTTCPVPIISNLFQMQQYTLQLTDANGCLAEDEIFVRVANERIVYVATGFTPNGDGVNDFLFAQGGYGSEKVISFQVYDRWGEKVFEAQDTPLNAPEMGWNGYFKNEVANSGTYGWFLEVEFNDGERLLFKGNTTLIR